MEVEMVNKYYGSLEYSITKGFSGQTILNIYLDHTLQINSRLKEGDRITMVYNFLDGTGMILKVKKNLPPQFLKTEHPALRFNGSNKHGKLTTWFGLNTEFRLFILLPIDVKGEQIHLKVTQVREGFIEFDSGRPKTIEQIAIETLEMNIEGNNLDEDELKEALEALHKLQRGFKIKK